MNFWDWLSIAWIVIGLLFWASGEKGLFHYASVMFMLCAIKGDTVEARKKTFDR